MSDPSDDDIVWGDPHKMDEPLETLEDTIAWVKSRDDRLDDEDAELEARLIKARSKWRRVDFRQQVRRRKKGQPHFSWQS